MLIFLSLLGKVTLVLIHSTTESNWKSIKSDQHLYSWHYLKQRSKLTEDYPIGHLLGDPTDYRDYIMLGYGDSIAGEYVVMSKQLGVISCNENATYQPGVRLYFDATKLAEAGLLVRDGAHLKVKEKLSLQPFLIDVVGPSMLDAGVSITPRAYALMANEIFEKRRRQPEGI